MDQLFDANGTKNKWWQVFHLHLSKWVIHLSLRYPSCTEISFIAYCLPASSHLWLFLLYLLLFYIHLWPSYNFMTANGKAFSKRKFMGKELKDWAKEYSLIDFHIPHWIRAGQECRDGDNSLILLLLRHIYCNYLSSLQIQNSLHLWILDLPHCNSALQLIRCFIAWLQPEFNASVNLYIVLFHINIMSILL